MWKLIPLALLQSALLVSGQIFLKLAMARMTPFGWNREFWLSALLNWQFAMSGAMMAIATILWMYLLKHYPLSMAYAMGSMSYLFAILCAILFFHEQIPITRWIGVSLIMVGCCMVAYK